jgi:hypothetical protein
MGPSTAGSGGSVAGVVPGSDVDVVVIAAVCPEHAAKTMVVTTTTAVSLSIRTDGSIASARLVPTRNVI